VTGSFESYLDVQAQHTIRQFDPRRSHSDRASASASVLLEDVHAQPKAPLSALASAPQAFLNHTRISQSLLLHLRKAAFSAWLLVP
jgi:hypothetical protein